MKVLFLDFDGVLNSDRYIACCGGAMALDPDKMILLKKIVDATGAKIVLTTSWREHWEKELACCGSIGREIHGRFGDHGMEIWDKTPQLPGSREAQIKAWLDNHPEVEGFAVLDDRLLSANFLQRHFVKTSNYFGGLNEEDVKQATEILLRR